MKSPFVFNVADILHAGVDAGPTQRVQKGPSPSRIGAEMIAIEKGEEVTVDATLTLLGPGILVDADISSQLTGQCVRCLRTLTPDLDIRVSQMFSLGDDHFTGDDEEDDGGGDALPLIDGVKLDLEQSVIDEVVLQLPFNPTCEGGCAESDDSEVPPPDGVSGEPDEDKIDPRWAGLEKFL